jgi:hypothetical protein
VTSASWITTSINPGGLLGTTDSRWVAPLMSAATCSGRGRKGERLLNQKTKPPIAVENLRRPVYDGWEGENGQ